MNDELRRIFRQHSQSLLDELTAQLADGSSYRYWKTDPQVLSQRCRLLAEALIRSTHQGTDELGEFVATVANIRFAEGFELEDLQRALRILEVAAWRIVVRHSSPESLVENLAALNTAMGHARDELARACQRHAYAARS